MNENTNDHPDIAKMYLTSIIKNHTTIYFRKVRSLYYKIYVIRNPYHLELVSYNVAVLLDLNYYPKSGTIRMQYDSYDAAQLIKQDIAKALGMNIKYLHHSMI